MVDARVNCRQRVANDAEIRCEPCVCDTYSSRFRVDRKITPQIDGLTGSQINGGRYKLTFARAPLPQNCSATMGIKHKVGHHGNSEIV